MVSSGNTVIIGLALVAGFLFLRSRGGVSTVESIFRNGVTPMSNAPTDSPQIQMLKDAIAGVQGFIKRTFKTPKPRSDCGNVGQLSCARKNFSPQPRGSRFAINPFTGLRIALPVGPRGSAVTERFQGGAQQLQANQLLVTRGNLLFTQSRNILKDLQSQLNILQTKSV